MKALLLSLCLMISCGNLAAQIDSYQRDREVEKNAQKLADWDKSQREAAKERAEKWDRGEYEQKKDEMGTGEVVCIALFFVGSMVFLVLYGAGCFSKPVGYNKF